MSTRHLESLARLRNDEDFKIVLAWVESLRERTKNDLTTANASVIHVLQGRAQAYKAIIDTAETAADVLSQPKSPASAGHF